MKSVKMQNVAQGSSSDGQKLEKVGVEHDHGKSSSTPQSSNSSPTKSDETYTLHPRFMTDSSESEEDDVSEVESFVIDNSELDEDSRIAAKFLLSEDPEHPVDPETQARLEALLEAAGIGKLSAGDGKHLADPEVLRRLTSSVSCALDEAAAALTRMRSDNPRTQQPETRSLVEACSDGDVGTVRKLLGEGRSVHETTEDGESLLSLACSAGYYELAQVLLAMHANVEDRGIKGDCTPLMEAASAGHVDIVRLLITHDADVNAQSSTGNTPLMYACAGGHEEVVKVLLEAGANVEDHNENGHTPLMEAASAGYVNVAKILLDNGAGINTHSNEFKESALTLACYKGHLEMVRFLLEAGADQEHKTDEMHTALMEASMDGHVEVARLLLDSGAQVNMPTDSFESPLTLAACGGHVDLAMLLIERGANIEEVNDEGYTPLMEAAREGHEEMVALLLSQGANINAQTEETQETALTLACCGGFLEVADFLIKAEADIEAGASTPLMEASQEGHLELVRYLLTQGADVNSTTTTGDSALTYACENGHTDVAELLLEYKADLEHESEGGRTPLMKACRAGHLCTVQFLISKNADVKRQTTNNDHTPLSLACAGGHLSVVEFLMAHHADPFHKLKDNSTMLIEAAKGGHTAVVQLLLDYPHNIMMQQQGTSSPAPPASGAVSQQPQSSHSAPATPSPAPPALHQVPEATRAQDDLHIAPAPTSTSKQTSTQPGLVLHGQGKIPIQKSLLRKFRPSNFAGDGAPACESITEISPHDDAEMLAQKSMVQLLDLEKKLKQQEEQILQKQILEELQRVEEELQVTSPHLLLGEPLPPSPGQPEPPAEQPSSSASSSSASPPASKVKVLDLPQVDYFNLSLPSLEMAFSALPSNIFPTVSTATLPASFYGSPASKLPVCGQQVEGIATSSSGFVASMPLTFQAPAVSTVTTPSIQNATVPTAAQILGDVPTSFQTACAPDSTSGIFSGSTSIQDRPKAKPISKKDAKNRLSKQQIQAALQQQHQLHQLQHLNQQLQAHVLHQTSSGEVAHAAAEAKVLLQQAGAEAAQAKSLLQQQAHTQHTIQQLHHIQNQLKQLEEAGIGNTPQTHLHQLLQKQLRALQQQVPRSLVEFANRGVIHDNKTNAAAKEDSGGESHLGGDKEEGKHSNEEAYPETYETTEDLLAALKVHVEDKAAIETQINYQRAVEDAISKSLLPGNLVGGQQQQAGMPFPGGSPLDNAASSSAAANTAALQRLEYIPVKMQLKQNTEMLAPGTSIHLSYQLPMVPATVSLPTSAFVPSTVPSEDSGLFTAVSSATCQPTQAQLQAISNRLAAATAAASASLSVPGFKPKQLQLLPPQIATPVVPETSNVSTNTSTPSSPVPCSSSSSTSSGLNNLNQATSSSSTVSASTQSVLTTANVPAVTQAATQTPNKKKSGKKTIWLPPSTRPVATHTTSTSTVAHHQHTQHAPPQQLTTQNQQQQTFDTDKIQPLISSQDVLQNYIDPNTGVPMYTNGTVAPYACPPCQQQFLGMDVDSETDSNHDTALTLGCAGGHEDLVELLLSRGADIEHRDKKGFTPLILAATAGHEKVVDILLNHGADIEAQSERTKDTPLSLACSGGRIEVVNLLLSRSANKEHRNVSDYTPLSLAASGGYVNIIKLLLNAGAEINSRTGSKLGISPLMLAAMNGHTAAVKLLLDMGSDINAQIETNRNTALTLACFQGRHEVVSLLLDRKANVEHRAKTGLTPLMEAASGGYVEVGRVLLDKGADVNAPPVPSSRDTALTIAADKGHVRFVELLLSRGAQVEVKNKKGNSPLWLAANGGHLSVIELLHTHGADIDSQDNRKVSCLMAAFRKGHVKAVKWMVNHVTQFPSDQEMSRYISTISVNEKELLDKCQECVQEIRAAKDMQAAKASMNADILLEELDMEKTREESKRAAAARRRERKKKKKLEKKEERQTARQDEPEPEPPTETPVRNETVDKEEGDSGIDANSQGSCSSNDVKSKEKRKEKKKKKSPTTTSGGKSDKENSPTPSPAASSSSVDTAQSTVVRPKPQVPSGPVLETPSASKENSRVNGSHNAFPSLPERPVPLPTTVVHNSNQQQSSNLDSGGNHNKSRKTKMHLVFEATPRQHPAERDDFEATGNESYTSTKGKKSTTYLSTAISHFCDSEIPTTGGKNSTSPKQAGKREEGWKEVVRKYVNSPFRSKKVLVPANAISRVIGRGGSNINAIRSATGAHIEVDKQTKGQGERTITIKGSADATKQAHLLISALVKDPEADLTQILPKSAKLTATSLAAAAAAWTQEAKAATAKGKSTTKPVALATSQAGSIIGKSQPSALHGTIAAWFLENNNKPEGSDALCPPVTGSNTTPLGNALVNALRATTTANKLNMPFSLTVAPRGGTAPRLAAAAEKRAAAAAAAAAAANTKTTMSYTTAIMTAGRATKIVTTTTTQTFAAKLTETSASSQGANTTTTQSQAKTSRGHSASANQQQQQQAIPQSPKHPHHHHHHQSNSSAPTSRSSTAGIPSLIDSAPITKPFLTDVSPISSNNGNNQNGTSAMHTTANSNASSNSSNSNNNSQQQTQGRNTPQQEQVSVAPVQPTPRSSAQTVTPLQQYSLFNDSKPVWGCENDVASQKGMNFASVAAAGSNSAVGQNNITPKFLENVPPQVDAAKAPGYRGNTMSSPVSSKASAGSTSASAAPNGSQFSAPSFSETSNLPNPVGSNSSKAVGSHNIARSASLAEVHLNQQQQNVITPVSQQDNTNFRHNMYSERDMPRSNAAVGSAPGHHHLMASSAATMMDPSQSQHHYTLAPSPSSSYEHQPPTALLKMVQHPPNNAVAPPGGPSSNLHHQDSQHHNMMGTYAPPPPPQPASANLSHFSQTPIGSSNSSSAASLSPPSMHSRLNPRAPDFSSSMHNMSSKQQQGSSSSQQSGPPSQSQQQQMQHQVGPVPPLFNMPPNSANNSSGINQMMMNQYKNMHHPSANMGPNTNTYHQRTAPPNHHQVPPPRWTMPMAHPMNHQQDLMNFLPPGTNLSGFNPEILGLENGMINHNHGSPTAMSPSSANNNSPPCGTAPGDQMTAHLAMGKHLDDQRRIPRPIGGERASWKSNSMNNAYDSEGWLGQDKMGGLPSNWASAAAAPGGPSDRHSYRVGMPPAASMRLVPEDTPVLDNTYHSHADSSHTFHNGGSAPLSLMQHGGFMPFVGTGYGPDVGPDMLSKMEAPSWDATAARMGLADIPDKSQNWGKWSQ